MSFIACAKYTIFLRRRFALVYVVLAGLAALVGVDDRAHGQVIISVSGNDPNIEATSISANHIVADGWSQTDAYVGVSISASLKNVSVPNAIGNAYLTTRIGQGTTMSDQIAATSFAFPPDFTQVPLFTDLTLPAGTYYLTISLGLGDLAGWQTIPEADVVFTLDSGVFPEPTSPGGGFFFAISPEIYPPGSTFSLEQDRHPVFTVTGVPEPSALMLVAVPLIYLITRRRRGGEMFCAAKVASMAA